MEETTTAALRDVILVVFLHNKMHMDKNKLVAGATAYYAHEVRSFPINIIF